MNNRGAALILAIFMMIVFGVIGAAIVTMLSTSSTTSSEDLISTQTFFIAESGVEIRIKQASAGDTSASKTYSYNNYSINVLLTPLSTITKNSEVKTMYKVKSSASIYNIRRSIIVKFWK